MPVCSFFPLAGQTWADFAQDPNVRGAQDGTAGYGGWHYRRSAEHVHRGIDLPAAAGHPVIAVTCGTAEYRSIRRYDGPGTFNAAGHRILLFAHDGQCFLYLHLGTNPQETLDAFHRGVAPGQRVEVRAGDVIGFAGFTGGSKATGQSLTPERSHLHFEWRPRGLEGLDANPVHILAALPSLSLGDRGTTETRRPTSGALTLGPPQ